MEVTDRDDWLVFPWENARRAGADEQAYRLARGLVVMAAKTIYLLPLPMDFPNSGRGCCCRNSSRRWKTWGLRFGNPSPATVRWIWRNPAGLYRVAQRDVQDVRDADALFAIVNGTLPDEGVMVELGVAIALR